MKNNFEDVDLIIKETLSKEEAKFYEELEELSLFKKMGKVFTGKNSWIVVLMNLISLVFLVIFFYCVVQFFKTDAIDELIRYGIIALFCTLYISMIKIYFWQQMLKNDLYREMKRLELQIAAASKH